MNWIEREYFAVADAQNLDAWIFGAALYKGCDHRWKARQNPAPITVREFYRLNEISVCTRCGAEA